jgi:catechol 2,3-dioxygenase-like lactoylglutathione lyase family enzyme
MTTTKPRFGFAIEYVKDIDAARRFYVDVLGLDVERTFPTYVQFDSFAIATDESMSGRGEPELYWLVDDAGAAFAEMSPQSKVSMELTQMPFGRLFAIENADGRPRYILQLAEERPSQAV